MRDLERTATEARSAGLRAPAMPEVGPGQGTSAQPVCQAPGAAKHRPTRAVADRNIWWFAEATG